MLTETERTEILAAMRDGARALRREADLGNLAHLHAAADRLDSAADTLETSCLTDPGPPEGAAARREDRGGVRSGRRSWLNVSDGGG